MAPSGSTEVLRAEGLERTIRGRRILSGVSLTVSEGEVVGLLGPNGAGKTTAFRLIAGLDGGEGGEVSICGRRADGLPLHRRAKLGLGYLPQEASVFRGLTVLDNVALVLELSGVKRAREEAAGVLEEFGLRELAGQGAVTLSGGERRRLEIARAVCLAPKVLICDEPLTGVDPKAAAELRAMLRELARKGVGVLLTDHNVVEALRACDRAYLVVDGEIVEEGSSAEIAGSVRARALYLGEGWTGAGSLGSE